MALSGIASRQHCAYAALGGLGEMVSNEKEMKKVALPSPGSWRIQLRRLRQRENA